MHLIVITHHDVLDIENRFTTPTATMKELEQLQDDVLMETLAYIPGASTFGASIPYVPHDFSNGNGNGNGFSENSNDRPTVAEARRKLPSLTRAAGMRASLRLTAGLMVFEQASGMTALLYYGGEPRYLYGCA